MTNKLDPQKKTSARDLTPIDVENLKPRHSQAANDADYLPPIIVVEDDCDDSTTDDTRRTDAPVFSIERVADNDTPADVEATKRTGTRWVVLILVVLLCVLAAVTYLIFRPSAASTLPTSLDDDDVIALLAEPVGDTPAVQEIQSDSVLGVAFDMYALKGLKASLEYTIPDPNDSTLRLFFRSADYRYDTDSYKDRTSTWARRIKNNPNEMGSIVVKGQLQHDDSETHKRPAFLAISPEGTPVMGISTTDKVMDYVAERGGDFFRQFVLVSNGVLPQKFYLHGKVERAAVGRMSNGEMYYFITRHPETMYDFADAMREYGVVDAIYITGGNGYDYHRDSEGNPVISEHVQGKFDKRMDTPAPAPYMVLRSH